MLHILIRGDEAMVFWRPCTGYQWSACNDDAEWVGTSVSALKRFFHRNLQSWQMLAICKSQYHYNLIQSNLHFATSIAHFGSWVRSGTWCEATHLTIFSTAEQIEVEEQSTARRTSFAGLIAFSMALSSMLSILLRWTWCTEWYRYGCKLPVATRWGEPTCCFAFFSVHASFFHPNSDLALTKVYIVYPGLPWLFLIVSY